MFEVKIIEDSQYLGSRLTTFQLKYPRFIHAEFMTHRVFSRNASSSRAIPVAKMIDQVENIPAMPIHWGLNQKGMQANQELSIEQAEAAKQLWLESAKSAAEIAKKMNEIGLHKQVANRIMEPFQWISVVMTTSYLDNFFSLRSHADAQPEIKFLSDMMMVAYNNNTPKLLKENEYHLPYIHEDEKNSFDIKDLLKFSVARCARVSYLTHDNQTPKPEADIALFDRLVGSVPLHASPTEHQAKPNINGVDMSGNFDNAWCQYRKYLEQNLEF